MTILLAGDVLPGELVHCVFQREAGDELLNREVMTTLAET
jgi:hypothetical protein